MTAAVFVTGDGVAAVVSLKARVGLVPYRKSGTVEVRPTVRLPFNLADVAVSSVTAFVVTVTAVFQLERLAAVKLPSIAASKAISSLANWVFMLARMSTWVCPAAISAL